MIDTLSPREQKILSLLVENPLISVADLGRQLGVSEVTVRLDLKGLDAKGVVVRSHGGAVPALNKAILDRLTSRPDEKNRIARAAADLVKDGDTVMVTAGTTTSLVVKYLLGKGSIHIVTDSALILPYVRSNPKVQLTLVGGEFRTANESVVGPLALEMIRRFNVRIAFLGTDGISLDRGLTTHLVEGAEMVKSMAGQAEIKVVVADSSKLGKSGFVSIMPLEGIDVLISDTGMPPETVAELEAKGIRVILA